MRSLPAGWPDPADVVQNLPSLYLYLPGSSWPPADADKGLPAGYALVVGSGSIHREFTGALMPGQVRAPSGFTIASATCEIAMPSTGRLAPWKTGSFKIASGGPAQLIASYDGPTGATAFSLGKFRLDPLVAKASESSMTVNLLDGMISLRQPNKILQHQVTTWTGAVTDATNNGYDPSDLINEVCTMLGIPCVTPDLGTTLTSIWFDPKKDTLTCLQELVAANLAAITSDETGAVTVHPFEELNGGTPIVDTVTIESTFDDLQFTLDPDDAYDRVELTYKTPAYYVPQVAGSFDQWSAADDWTAPAGGYLAPGQTYDVTVYNKKAILLRTGYTGTVQARPNFDGTGTVVNLTFTVTPVSSGQYRMHIVNNTATGAWLVKASGEPLEYQLRLDGTATVIGPYALHDVGDDDQKNTVSTGVNAEDAFNSLSIDVNGYIQNAVDAQMILDRITAITSVPRFKFSSVRVPLDLRRQLVDCYALQSNDAEFDLNMKGMVTAYDLSWNAEQGEMAQTVDLAMLDLTTEDFDFVWNRWNPAATTDDFNAFWDARNAVATTDDFDADPLAHP